MRENYSLILAPLSIVHNYCTNGIFAHHVLLPRNTPSPHMIAFWFQYFPCFPAQSQRGQGSIHSTARTSCITKTCYTSTVTEQCGQGLRERGVITDTFMPAAIPYNPAPLMSNCEAKAGVGLVSTQMGELLGKQLCCWKYWWSTLHSNHNAPSQ